MRIIDTVIAIRVAYLLITPIDNTDAFKLGLIDDTGKTVRKAKTPEERKSTSPLHRLVWNLKRIIGLIPGGSTRIGSLAACYLLMKEAYENEWSESVLTENTIIRFSSLCSSDINEEFEDILKKLSKLMEDAPANATGVSTSTDPASATKEIGLVRRKKFKVIKLP